MPRSKIFFSALLLVMLAGPGSAMATENQGAKPDAATPAGEVEDPCQKKVSIKGRPHRISAVASFGAVRAWTQMAMKYGENYGMWHNAENQTIKCEKPARSDYYVCTASAKPCRAANTGKTAAK